MRFLRIGIRGAAIVLGLVLVASGAADANAAEQKAKLSPRLRECYAAYQSAIAAGDDLLASAYSEAGRHAAARLRTAAAFLKPKPKRHPSIGRKTKSPPISASWTSCSMRNAMRCAAR